MTLNEVYDYLKANGLPVTLHDDNTRIRLEGSTAALDDIVFIKVERLANETSCTVASSPGVWLTQATYRDLDELTSSYLEHCDHERQKRVRSARLRYAIDKYNERKLQ